MTRVFKLPSGPEVEVDEMITKHQRLLTEQKNGTGNERLNLLVESLLIRVGSLHLNTLSKEERREFVMNLASRDKREILIQIRQFTLDDDMSMSLQYKYKSKIAGDNYGKEKKELVTGSLTIESTTYKKLTGEVDESGFPIYEDINAVEYSDFNKTFIVVLPKSKQTVRFSILDGYGEKRASMLKSDNISSNSTIEIRNPVFLVDVDKDGTRLKTPVWIKLDLDKQGIRDTEYLRKVISNVEGESITTVTFRHPEADILDEENQFVTIDALGETAFFFPSGVI